MALPSVDFNFWAIILASLLSMIIGALWHSPALFGKHWMKFSNITKADMAKAKSKGMAMLYIYAFLTTVVMAFILSIFVDFSGATTINQGIFVGFLVWLGFVATVKLNLVIWENKPWQLYLIGAGHHLISLVVMGAIIALWQ